MTADERANTDRRDRGDDAAEDVREEYTAYRETGSEKSESEAEGEAEEVGE